jgi:anti-sigma B factor antagonist
VIELEREGGVVRAKGRLDLVGAPQLRTVVDGAVAEGERRIVLDLGGVEFIDSSGLGAVINGLRAARQAGGDLRVAGASGQVVVAMELMKLDKMFRRYDSVEDALGDDG